VRKETIEFIHGERNAARDEFVISREKCGNSEYVCVSLPNERPLYKGWAKRIKQKIELVPNEELATIETIVEGNKPKHIGGRRPYIMVMQDKSKVIDQLSMGASGLLFKLFCGGYVEWGTGRVIDKRSKKAMTVKRMCEKLDMPLSDARALLKELAGNQIVTYDRSKKAYFVDRSIAKKGGGRDEDKV